MRHLLSQLAHVELCTPKPEETLSFFTDLLGLEESGRKGDSVYLRGWGEWFHHSIKVTAAPEARLGHAAFRTDGPEALEKIPAELAASGVEGEWIDGDVGHGRAYRFADPGGHPIEAFWEVERFQPTAAQTSKLRSRPQRYTGRGAAARRLDHVNLFAVDVAAHRQFYTNALGFKYNESLRVDGSEVELGAWLSVTNLAHDVGLIADPTGMPGRLNHVALWQDTREEVMRTADILADAGIFIEAGPGHHGATDSFYLYVYEPGGHRIEIYSGGYLTFDPQPETVVWHLSDQPKMFSWWSGAPDPNALVYGTPHAELAGVLA